MILYVNGDSHTAAAEAVNPHAFAEDDYKYKMMGRVPHPENLEVSYGKKLSQALKMMFICEAESASSNARIIRTTKEWMDKTKETVDPSETFIVIQWSTWEREEWEIDGEVYQVNASGIDEVPASHQEQYKQWIVDIDWDEKTREAYKEIIEFHKLLKKQGFNHLFFNGNNHFMSIPEDERYDFGPNYIEPYLPEGTFDGWLRLQGYDTVITSNYHYGPSAHSAWMKHLLQHIIKNEMIK